MRRIGLLFVLAAVPAITAPLDHASAFGDRCFYPNLAARGGVQGSMSAARSSAIAAWEQAARRRHGARFADWWYSGDRTIDCSWDNSGRRIRCTADAAACGRK